MTTNHRVAHLRVKIRSLMAEAGIIRSDELRHLRGARVARSPERADRHRSLHHSLREHRRTDVRSAARAALLAYGLLRGVPYRSIERPGSTEPDESAVVRNVRTFGELPDDRARALVRAWLSVDRVADQAA